MYKLRAFDLNGIKLEQNFIQLLDETEQNIVIYQWRAASDKSRYFAQSRPIIVYFIVHMLRTLLAARAVGRLCECMVV